MTRYILSRLLGTLPVMGVVALLIFLLLHLTPGDPATVIAGDMATEQDIVRIRAGLGLDQPLWKQFADWCGRILSGDLGHSIFSNLPVTRLLAERLPPTVSLTVTTLLFSVCVGVPAGAVAAWNKGRFSDRTVMTMSVLGFSMPVFLIGYLLIVGFALNLKWLPVQGYKGLDAGWLEYLKALVLPTITASAAYIALIARITRASLLEVLNQDYIRTARAKGLAPRRILLLHALKNAAVPIVTVIGSGVALLLGGVVVTESVFALPGLGRLTVDAVIRRDYPIVQGVILLFSGVYVLVNLAVDLSYSLFDPSITYTKAE